jgi:hypothetical protein
MALFNHCGRQAQNEFQLSTLPDALASVKSFSAKTGTWDSIAAMLEYG